MKIVGTLLLAGTVNAQPCDKKLKVEIKSDNFPQDLAVKVNGPGVRFVKSSGFVKNGIFSKEFCVKNDSVYRVTFKDEFGDGYCCGSGKGYYKVLIDGREVVMGGRIGQSFTVGEKTSITHKILTSPREPTGIDREYLEAHNKRRKAFHESNGVDYRPMKWSFSLKSDAKKWANHLLHDSCLGGGTIYHAPNNPDGENITATKGGGGWSIKPTPEKVLTRFVDRQMTKPPKSNSHLTQAMWRSSRYVGCAEASRDHGNGKKCHIQVCRYVKPGNCGMGDWSNWKKLTLQDNSGCGRLCPTEGCY